MKKYDSYKDSGIEWIGEIPKHWNITKAKLCSDFRMGQTILKEDVNDEGDFPVYSATEGDHYFGRINNPSFILEPGDIVIPARGNSIGFVALVHELSVSTQTTIANFIDKSKMNSKYVFYFYKGFRHTLFHFNATAIPQITVDQVKQNPIICPPFIEQTIIANYLDHKTSQIDDLIAKKERLIQLLEEERTAIINQAVTKGLDTTVPMKDSGIEWLGEIPAHWEVKRMRYLSDITTGGKDTENREDDGIYPFYVRSQTVERISTYSFDGEAILTAGDGVGVCKVWHYVNEKFDFHQRVYMLCNFRAVLGKYLFYYLKENFGKEVMKLSAKSTVDSLRRPMFQNFLVCFGTIEEQNEIILKIEKEEHRIQTITAKTQQEIELLKEYKTALISEVVTGKVDVRDWVAKEN